jgi:hypothetical protein
MAEATTQPSAVLFKALQAAPGDVVRCADELLRLCYVHGFAVECQPDLCRVRCEGDGVEHVVPNPFRKSVFRAILARIAALCNAAQPHCASPYGGCGELLMGSAVIHVAFANTPDDQWLKLEPGQTPPAGDK